MNTCIELSNMYYEFMLDSLSEDQQLMEAMIGSDMLEIRGITEAEEKKDNIFKKIWAWIKEQFNKLINFLKGLKDKIVGFFRKKKNDKKADEVKEKIINNDKPSSTLALPNKSVNYPITISINTKLGKDVLDDLTKTDMLSYIRTAIDDIKEELNINKWDDAIDKTIIAMYKDPLKLSDVAREFSKGFDEIKDYISNSDELFKAIIGDVEENPKYIELELNKNQCISVCDSVKQKDKVEKLIESEINEIQKTIATFEKRLNNPPSDYDELAVQDLKKIVTQFNTIISTLSSVASKLVIYVCNVYNSLLNAINLAFSKQGSTYRMESVIVDEEYDDISLSNSLSYLF